MPIKTILLIDDKKFDLGPKNFLKNVRSEICSLDIVDDDAALCALTQDDAGGDWQGRTQWVKKTEVGDFEPWPDNLGIIEKLGELDLNTVKGGLLVLCDYDLKHFDALNKNGTLLRLYEVMDALDHAVGDGKLWFIVYTTYGSTEAKANIQDIAGHALKLKHTAFIPQILLLYKGKEENNPGALRVFLEDNMDTFNNKKGAAL